MTTIRYEQRGGLSRLVRTFSPPAGVWAPPPWELPNDWQFSTATRLFSRKPTAWDYSFNLAAQTGTVRTVIAGSFSDLQAQINAAQPGDIVVIPLGTYVGNIILPAKTGAGWIYLIGQPAYNGSFPKAPGQRVAPSDASAMPSIVGSTTNVPTIVTASSPNASFYRWVGVEVTQLSSVSLQDGLIRCGYSGYTQLSDVPHHHVVDRCYVHGLDTTTTRRCVVMNIMQGAVLDSYLANAKEVGADSQAFVCWNGPGPLDIINTYLEGAGENSMIGGSDASIVNMTPSDITFSRCHIKKQLTWKTSSWSIKNSWELKHAKRVLLESSIIENFWQAGQTFPIMITPANQDGGNPWATISDVTLRYVKCINVEEGAELARSSGPGVTIPGSRYSLEHILFDQQSFTTGANRRMYLILGDCHDILIAHTTGFSQDQFLLFVNGGTDRVTVRDNLQTHGLYGLAMDGDGEGNSAISNATTNFADEGNVWIGCDPAIYPVGSPTPNRFPVNEAAVGMMDFAGGDYRLSPASPYKGTASDGTDPGCDIDFVESLVAGVAS